MRAGQPVSSCRSSLLIIAVLLCPLALGGGRQPAPALAAGRFQAGTSRLLYRWTFPARGQSGPWIFDRGVATYDGESNVALFARFTLPHLDNYAVQATMQGQGAGGPEAELAGFGVVVRKTPSNPHTSIAAGSYFSADSENNNPEIYWNGDTVGGGAFNPGSAWHVYRLEVHGSDYTLFIDGTRMVEYTIKDYPFPTRAGMFSTYYKVRVKDFRILALDAPAAPAAEFPPTKPFNLTVSDLPSTTFYQPTLQHYYPDLETARERGISLAALQATGRIVSYGADFYTTGAAVVDVYSSVTAFDTPAHARADIGDRLSSFRKEFAGQPNLHDVPQQPVGEFSGGLGFDFTAGGYKATLLVVLFQRGSYDGLMRVTINGGTMTQDELLTFTDELSKIVDQRIQHAGQLVSRRG